MTQPDHTAQHPLAYAFHRVTRMMELSRAKRILVCLRYGIGDVVMETPVLETLRQRAPAAHITALGAPPAVTLLEGDPRVDDLVSIADFGLTHRWDDGTPETRLALERWIAERDFDVFLDVHHAATAVGTVVWGRGIRTLEAVEATEETAVAEGSDGVAAIRAAVRDGWGLDVADDLMPRLHLDPTDHDFARAFLDKHGIRIPPVGISPVASAPLKRWPTERFAAFADWVVEHTGRTPLLVCGPQHDTADAVLAAMRHPERVVRLGPIHLRRVAALLERCALFVCNDTGVMHMAAALGTPVIGIFGPTSPRIYLPPAPHAVGLVGRDIRCPYRNTSSLQPPGCWNAEHCLIGEHSCIERVPLASVKELAVRLLGLVPDTSRALHA